MRNIPIYNDGDTMAAAVFDDIPEELENAITQTGIALTSADSHQLAKTIANMVAVGDFYQDSGVANAYILSAVGVRMAPTAYINGMRIRFTTNNPSTGSATINVAGLGVKDIMKEDNTLLDVGDIASGEENELVYIFSTDNFRLKSHKFQNNVFMTGDGSISIATSKNGWVHMNDGTIGSATSSATTRANADCEQLFKLLWNNVADAQAPVIGGRLGTADLDWAANKQITLTKQLGRSIISTGAGAGLTNRILGETGGEEYHQITVPEIASHTHSPITRAHCNAGGGAQVLDNGTAPYGATTSTGGNQPHNNMQPFSAWNIFIKL
jgi:hypothetical protein